MRKFLFRTSTIVTVLLLMVLACQKDKLNQSTSNENDDATSMSVAEAKTWFEANKQPDMVLKDGNLKEIKKIGIKPDWGSGATSKNSDIEVVETDLQVQGDFGFADESSYSQWKVNKDNTLISSVTRMVFMKNKKSGKIDQFLMTIVGNKDYHDNNAGQLVGNAYLKRDKHFSGHIYYHDLAGNFVNGWKYEKGKLVAESTQTTGEVLPIHLKSATCSTYTIYTIYVDCTDWYVKGIWDRVSCGAPYAVETGSYTDCMINPPNSGGGGGGYNPAPPTPPAPPCDCVNICNTCGGCLDTNQLKSAGINCPGPCTCPKIVEDPSFVGTKADCVKKKLEYGNILNNLLGDFNLNTSLIDVTFIVGNIASGDNGQCVYNRNTFCMDITINTPRLNASSLQLARTILHESFHAYIYGKLYDSKLHNALCPEPNFQADIDEYRRLYDKDPNCTQHSYIADKYIPYMKQALNDYFNIEPYKSAFLGIAQNNVNWQGTDFLFECLAWEGLQGTDAYTSFMSDPGNREKYMKTMDIARLLPSLECPKK